MSKFLNNSALNHKAYWRLKTAKLRGFKILLVRLEDIMTQTNTVQTGEMKEHIKDSKKCRIETSQHYKFSRKKAFPFILSKLTEILNYLTLCHIFDSLHHSFPSLTVNIYTYSSVLNLSHSCLATFSLLCCTCFFLLNFSIRHPELSLSLHSHTPGVWLNMAIIGSISDQ